MARISGINLPKHKRVEVGLTYIAGIGRNLSSTLLEKLSIDKNTKVSDLTDDEVHKLREEIAKIPTEGDLRRKIAMDIKRLQEIGTYRGFRHKKGLPCRGQKTKTNARTKKGKKKTIANKKKITK